MGYLRILRNGGIFSGHWCLDKCRTFGLEESLERFWQMRLWISGIGTAEVFARIAEIFAEGQEKDCRGFY